VGHPVKPIRQQISPSDGRRFPTENEEGGLKGIFSVVLAEETTANVPNQPAVALDEAGKGRFIAALDEASEQLAVG
jgi:hypothetical protein